MKRDKEGHYIMIKGSIQEEDITIINIYFRSHFHALEKEMATHSSVLAWRIPRTEEPGRLQSMELRSQTGRSSYSLCLLVGAFNPFTFKVITDKYVPVAIYFIVLGSSLYTVFVSCLENIL